MNANNLHKTPEDRSKDRDDDDDDDMHAFSQTYFGRVYSTFGYQSCVRRCGAACGRCCEFEAALQNKLGRIKQR